MIERGEVMICETICIHLCVREAVLMRCCARGLHGDDADKNCIVLYCIVYCVLSILLCIVLSIVYLCWRPVVRPFHVKSWAISRFSLSLPPSLSVHFSFFLSLFMCLFHTHFRSFCLFYLHPFLSLYSSSVCSFVIINWYADDDEVNADLSGVCVCAVQWWMRFTARCFDV